MNQTIRILGIDPALQNTGMAIADYNVVTGDLKVVKLVLTETAPSSDGKVVRRSSDDMARASTIVRGIKQMIAVYRPNLAAAEIPTGTQSARGAFSNGICCGVLADFPIPLIEVSAYEVKLAGAGVKNATKDQMIQWAVGKWPDAGWLTYKKLGKVELNTKNEHLADACGAISAGILTVQFAQATAMMAAMRTA